MATPVIRLATATLVAGLSYLSLSILPAIGVDRENHQRTEEIRTMVAAARSNIDRGQFVLALPPAAELHRRFPQNHVYIELLATVYRQLRRFGEEAAMWEQFLLYSPVPIEGCPQVGIAWRNSGQSDKARDALNRCLQFEAGNPDVLYQLGYTDERSNPAAAEAIYRRGLETAPEDPDLIVGLGRVELRLGRAPDAEARARRALLKYPDHTDALLLGGLALTRLNKLEEAKRFLEKGMQLSPSYTDIPLALAAIAERQHDYSAAARYYQRVLDINPEDGTASIGLAALRSRKR